MVRAGDQRQKTSVSWCCFVCSFGVFWLIPAARWVKILTIGTKSSRQEDRIPQLKPSWLLCYSRPVWQSDGPHRGCHFYLGQCLGRPTICRWGPWRMHLEGWDCLATDGIMVAAFEKGVRFQAHHSTWCLPTYRWFNAQWLVSFYCLLWVLTPLVHSARTFHCWLWPSRFHSKDQKLKH